MKFSSDAGSTPLEIVTSIALLLLPLTPMVLISNQLSQEVAAESIARNALRYAILHAPEDPDSIIGSAVSAIAISWGANSVDYKIWCNAGCQLVNLEVRVGNASAVHTMGLEP